MIRQLLTHPNKLLRKRSREVLSFDDLAEIVTDATDTMLGWNVSGLALVQIGIPLRVIVLNCVGSRTVTLVNPKIEIGEGRIVSHESCPSIPGRVIEVERFEYVKVSHTRPYGLEIFESPEPLLSVALQHEIDHLNGVLSIDRDRIHHPGTLH